VTKGRERDLQLTVVAVMYHFRVGVCRKHAIAHNGTIVGLPENMTGQAGQKNNNN